MDRKHRQEYKRRWQSAARYMKRLRNEDQYSSSDSESNATRNVPYSYHSALHEQCAPAADDISSECSCATNVSDSYEGSDFQWNWDKIDDHIEISSESDEDYGDDLGTSLCKDLRGWVNNFNVPHNAVDGILKILKGHGHEDLPLTARTLLKTPREILTETRSGLQFIHLGLQVQLLKFIRKYAPAIRQKESELKLSFNIDGLPIFKSTGQSLWPVLCSVTNLKPCKVFLVSLCHGASKPAGLDFLTPVIEDINNLLQNQLFDEELNITYSVAVKCIVCDAPAKAMVKATKQYSGYFGCDKCNQKGVWHGRMTFPEVETVELRTDQSFRNHSNPEHHLGETPLCQLPIDMIKAIPIDYMHQSCLGVQKRLLLTWLRGPKEVRLSAGQAKEISQRLVALRRFVPNLFARKPRGLDELDRWKATEYRQFLLYTATIVLKGILRDDLYKHFLVLSVALRILVSQGLALEHNEYAHKLLQYFVSQSKELYGQDFIVYNVHCLTHLAAEAQEFGTLDACSAFLFENHLQKLKKKVRSTKNPLVEIVKRLEESQMEDVPAVKERKMAMKRPNNAYILNTLACCEVVNESCNEYDNAGNKLLLCRVFRETRPLYEQPCDSRLTGISAARMRNTYMTLLPRCKLSKKAMLVEQNQGECIIMAVLHEY